MKLHTELLPRLLRGLQGLLHARFHVGELVRLLFAVRLEEPDLASKHLNLFVQSRVLCHQIGNSCVQLLLHGALSIHVPFKLLRLGPYVLGFQVLTLHGEMHALLFCLQPGFHELKLPGFLASFIVQLRAVMPVERLERLPIFSLQACSFDLELLPKILDFLPVLTGIVLHRILVSPLLDFKCQRQCLHLLSELVNLSLERHVPFCQLVPFTLKVGR